MPGPLTSATIGPGTPTRSALRPRLPSVVGINGVAAQLGGLDEQISWPTAERAAPDLAYVGAVGYSVGVWIDGKEKVYGSIREEALTRDFTLYTHNI